MMKLSGKVAIVTGAGSGIGKAIAIQFAKEGAQVIINDYTENGLKVLKEIEDTGGQAIFYQADVRLEKDIKHMMNDVKESFGKIDILVNNAGLSKGKNLVDTSDVEWDKIMDTNLKGAWYCCKHAIPIMIEGGGGSILNIASTHVYRTQQNHFPYQSAKAGMLAMTNGICVDFGSHGIRANSICPGFIETPLAEEHLQQFPNRLEKEKAMLATHPVGRFGKPEDIAYAATFLSSEEASFICGAALIIDGGRSIYQKAD